MKDSTVLLLGPKNYLVDKVQRTLNIEYGLINAEELKSKKIGDKIRTHTGTEFTIAKPTIIDLFEKRFQRKAQVVMPKDASMILAYTGIPSSSFIVDAGSGSGFLAIFLAYYCSDGKVITYEKNPDFAKIVEKNIELSGLKNIAFKAKNILDGIEEKNVDLITLDMKSAEKVVKNAHDSLKNGGWLVIYSPYIEQVKIVKKEIEKFTFTQIKIMENITREWKAEYDYTRPKNIGLMHTCFITLARKY